MTHESNQWYDIPDFEGLYQISNTRQVKSLARTTTHGNITRLVPEKILKPITNKIGSKGFNLSKNGKIYSRTLSSLMKATMDIDIEQPYFYIIKIHAASYFGVNQNLHSLVKQLRIRYGNAELAFSTPINTDDNIKIMQKVDDMVAILAKPISPFRYDVTPEIISKIFSIIYSTYLLGNIS